MIIMFSKYVTTLVILSLLPGLTLAGNNRAPVSDASGTAAMEQRLARLERLLNSQGLLDLLQQVEALQIEIGRLRGQVEVQNHELSQLKEQQKNRFVDIDRRIQQIETGATASTGNQELEAIETDAVAEQNVGTAGTELTVETTVAENVTTETTTEDNEAPAEAETAASTEEPAQAEQAEVDPLRAQAEYQQAFQLLKKANYEQAIKAFSEYLEKYPNSQYSDNAQYWLGETFYVTQKFDNAINAYQSLIDNYPESRKVAHGMLKLGYSYQELGNLPEAKKRLESLKSQFPGSTAARLADERLRTIKIPGSS